jgi:hypothetical protein
VRQQFDELEYQLEGQDQQLHEQPDQYEHPARLGLGGKFSVHSAGTRRHCPPLWTIRDLPVWFGAVGPPSAHIRLALGAVRTGCRTRDAVDLCAL